MRPQAFPSNATSGQQLRYPNIRPATTYTGSRSKTPIPIAQVHHPILGIDFLQHFDILVDVRSRKLIDRTTTLMDIGKATSINSIGLRLALPPRDEFTELLSQFPSILSPNCNANATNNVEHGVEHHIVTSGPPVFQRPRRLPPEKYKVAQQEFQFLLNQGIIRPSNSAWSSPLHMVPKKDPGD